ncbi:MAG: hypothetical protein L3J29_01485 [Cyclobacteriaceae bacterium]|nr:hypothetical protein [Cyclobacteriaceae bacterium]
MKAIEIESKTDAGGNLKIDYKLAIPDRKVRVLILVDDVQYENQEEDQWMKSISKNPAFEFLDNPAEDIYSKKDGKPVND